MRKLFVCLSLVLLFMLFATQAYSTDLTFRWDPVVAADLAGYRLFTRTPGNDYNYATPAWDGQTTTCTITIPDDPYEAYFVARAYDDCNNESGNSNELKYDTQGPPSPGISCESANLCLTDINEDGAVTKDDRTLFNLAYKIEYGRKDCKQ